jgi:hypothetical protein
MIDVSSDSIPHKGNGVRTFVFTYISFKKRNLYQNYMVFVSKLKS